MLLILQSITALKYQLMNLVLLYVGDLVDSFPEKENPKDLSQERKLYLYKEIKQYCRTNIQDLVAQNYMNDICYILLIMLY